MFCENNKMPRQQLENRKYQASFQEIVQYFHLAKSIQARPFYDEIQNILSIILSLYSVILFGHLATSFRSKHRNILLRSMKFYE